MPRLLLHVEPDKEEAPCAKLGKLFHVVNYWWERPLPPLEVSPWLAVSPPHLKVVRAQLEVGPK